MNRKFKVLFILTIFNLLAIFMHLFLSRDEIVWDQIVSDQEMEADPGRNERSTPREFILPSTAAVAEAQESKHLALIGINQERCFQVLRAKGHQIVSNALLHNVDLARSLVIEQRAFGVEASGKLNRTIAEKLECLDA